MPDDMAAELGRIAAELRTSGASDDDTTRLLAAVEAVLELAGEAQQVDTGGTWIPCWDLDPAEVREAISREITGKEESGDGR